MFAHLAALALSTCISLGEEEFGNKPRPNDPDWAQGVVELANDAHRVYRRWVNGNQEFFFQGDSAAVNRALEQFARVEADLREVVLMPKRGRTDSFDSKKRIDFDWRLYAPSGLCLGPARAGNPPVYPPHATLTVHVQGAITLERLRVPAGITLIAPDQLLERYQRAAEQREKDYALTIGHAARTRLATEITPHSPEEREHYEALRDFVQERRGVELELEWNATELSFRASLVNRRGSAVTILLPGDGSDRRRRTPFIVWEVSDAKTGEAVPPLGFIGCGNMDPLLPDDIVTLAPSERCDLGRWLGKPHIPEDGAYRVRLVYGNVPTWPAMERTTDDATLVEAVHASTPLYVTSDALEVTVRR